MIHRSTAPITVSAHHIVYGSLPTRDRGYELLGQSPRCPPDQIAQVIAACRRYGQPPSAAASLPAWFALSLPAGPWAVVTVDPQGADDQGRPGALIFDAILVPAKEMAATVYNVAAFVGRGKTAEWPATTIPATVARLRFEVERLASGRSTRATTADSKEAAIVAALANRRKVALEADGPIDGLVRAVWAQLSTRVRRRSSVATWAFGAENRFHLMAVPRLAGVALDATYLAPESLVPPTSVPIPREGRSLRERLGLRRDRADHESPVTARGSLAIGLGGMALIGVAALVWASGLRERNRLLPPEPAVASLAASVQEASEDLGPAARTRALRGLQALGERFRAFDLGEPGDPSTFLSRVADRLHYHGPLLSEGELARLRAAAPGSPDAARAVRWHEQIQTFRDDQPWPARFADLTLAGQLRGLGRSFHLDPQTDPEAVPDALIVRLARAEVVSPNPIGADFPALGSYARFLTRLPRRDDPAEPDPTDR